MRVIDVFIYAGAVIFGAVFLPLSLLKDLVLGSIFFGLFWVKERLTYRI